MFSRTRKSLRFRGISWRRRKSRWLDRAVPNLVGSGVGAWKEAVVQLRSMRKGSKVSRVLRMFFEARFARTVLGTMVVVVGMMLILAQGSVGGAYVLSAHTETANKNVIIEDMSTERGVQKPLPTYKVNQRYRFYHRGLDLDGETGDEIKPVSEGDVQSVIFSGFAYGNHVVVNHGSGFMSLYAHMSQVYVKPGQKVSRQHLLGRVGSTGWSTGPHLHLEFVINGEAVDPQPYLE